MITCRQVADLRAGDVVELTFSRYPDVTIRGPLSEDEGGGLLCGFWPIRHRDGTPPTERGTLTVLTHAPRPLYVNHPRTEPVPGDVVRDGDGQLRIVQRSDEQDELVLWGFGVLIRDKWLYVKFRDTPEPIRLLVDGETGQVVQ